MGDFLDRVGLARVKAKIDTLLAGKLDTSLKGTANGIAELDANGHVPATQLPSYVDDVIEYQGSENFPTYGESDKIYVDTLTGLIYRWSGTMYVEVSESIALGETSSTAYRGDRGKVAYDHASAKGSAFATGLYKITTNDQGHVTSAAPVTKADITDLGIPGSDTNTTYSFSNNNPTLAWNTTSTVGTVGGVALTVKLPANPNTNTTYSFSNSAPTLAWNTTSTVGTVGGVALTVKMPANPNTDSLKNHITLAGTNGGGTDTTAVALNGLNVRWYSATGQISGQPTQYGFLQTVAAGDGSAENHQLWFEQANGNLYHRGTNGSSHTAPPAFKRILDSGNFTVSNTGPTLAWNTTSTVGTVGGTALTVKLPANPNTNTTYAFSNGNPTLAWGTKSTVGTVGGTALTVTMPGNPNTNTWKANTSASEGYVASGSGKNSQVWKTDGSGNPAWRADANTNTTYSFSNNNPTLAWGTKSTVGTVGGVALTLTMPGNPNTNTTYSFSNNNPTLAWGTKSTVGTVGGVALTVTMPGNPNTNTWRGCINNLTSTVTDQSLSAAQGKALNDKIASVSKVVNYTYAYGAISSGGNLDITGTQLKVSTPSGYAPVAMTRFATGHPQVIPALFNARNTGSEVVIRLRALAAVTGGTVYISILYIRNS